MYLTRRDLIGTVVAALVVVVYVANVQEWWYLSSNSWAAVTMLVFGVVGCPLGARLVGEKLSSARSCCSRCSGWSRSCSP